MGRPERYAEPSRDHTQIATLHVADIELPPEMERLAHVPVRKETRFSVSFRVDTFAAGAGTPEPALALNLSQNGMLMEASAPLEVGEDVVLSFPLGEEPPDVRSRGRVVRVAASTQYGIEFQDVPPDVTTRLHDYLETLGQA